MKSDLTTYLVLLKINSAAAREEGFTYSATENTTSQLQA